MTENGEDLVLWLACDLTADGQDLGTSSLKRLVRAWLYAQKTGATMGVAAGKSKDFPTQPMTMAKMAERYLKDWGCEKLIVLEADEFTTVGELRAFMGVATSGRRTIVSADWHLRRTRVIFTQMYGKAAAQQIVWEPALLDTLDTFRSRALEAAKWAYIYMPKWLQLVAVICYRRLFGNPSWIK